MNNNSKCFIKVEDGGYKEITYAEFKLKRDKWSEKKFINVQNMLFEVNKDEFKKFHNETEKARYKEKIRSQYKTISIESLSNSDNVRGKDVIPDITTNIEGEIEKKIELQKLKNALMQLNDDEYELIKKIFFEELSIRKYAEKVGKPKSTIDFKKKKVLEKLKKFLEN